MKARRELKDTVRVRQKEGERIIDGKGKTNER
jgi:hypothetical protein